MKKNKIKTKNIKEICEEIDLIITGKDNKIDYKHIYLDLLDDELVKNISYDDIELICETIIKIAITKNRILRYLEKEFWAFLNELPSQIVMTRGFDISEDEELQPNTDYDNTQKKNLSRLLGLVQEIIDLKDDNSKGSDLRRAGSLIVLGDLINYYHIPAAKKLFMDSIKNKKNIKEQYAALEGLENYYDVAEEKIDDDLLKILNDIMNDTYDRIVALSCLQIQINAGIISQMTAVSEIEDWQEKHWRKHRIKNTLSSVT